jgi:serine/threonine protein kinase
MRWVIETLHFIATEFIDGVTLRERITHTRMTVQEVLDVAVQVASALVASHAARVVHRDIKPENIIIRRDGIVKVLDFGIAKLLEPHSPVNDLEAPTRVMMNTSPGVMIGTVSYMSPEQARGVEVDARTDIWSFGVMLYEMLFGRVPFQGPTISHIVVSILEHEPPLLTGISVDAPAELQRIISKTLCKNIDERYQTINEVLAERECKTDLYFEARVRAVAVTTPSANIPGK